MCNWHDHLADLVLPLYQLIAAKLRKSSYLKADETPIDCLEPGKGETATGYFWVYHHPEHGPLFDWHKSRANTCLDKILIDDEKRRASAQLRKRARQLLLRRTYHHLKKLFKHLQKHRRILPQSNLGKALHYALDQWCHLEPCFLDGQIEFDNNHTEGAIRPTKLGAKNWMFIGNEDTGWRSAVIYTFVEQIRRHGMDPFAYFEWVFEKLMHSPSEDKLEALLPVNWVASQRSEQNLQESAA